LQQRSLVPASEAEVSVKWLRNTLASAFPNITFETIRAERVGEGFGLASRIVRYRWDSVGPPRSVVVKLWDTDGPGGEREVSFYNSFGKAVGARIPACYHAAVDSDRKRGVLILEDLRNVVQGDCLRLLALDHAKAVARSLAGVHATWGQNDENSQSRMAP
jgi:hypothetical protein